MANFRIELPKSDDYEVALVPIDLTKSGWIVIKKKITNWLGRHELLAYNIKTNEAVFFPSSTNEVIGISDDGIITLLMAQVYYIYVPSTSKFKLLEIQLSDYSSTPFGDNHSLTPFGDSFFTTGRSNEGEIIFDRNGKNVKSEKTSFFTHTVQLGKNAIIGYYDSEDECSTHRPGILAYASGGITRVLEFKNIVQFEGIEYRLVSTPKSDFLIDKNGNRIMFYNGNIRNVPNVHYKNGLVEIEKVEQDSSASQKKKSVYNCAVVPQFPTDNISIGSSFLPKGVKPLLSEWYDGEVTFLNGNVITAKNIGDNQSDLFIYNPNTQIAVKIGPFTYCEKSDGLYAFKKAASLGGTTTHEESYILYDYRAQTLLVEETVVAYEINKHNLLIVTIRDKAGSIQQGCYRRTINGYEIQEPFGDKTIRFVAENAIEVTTNGSTYYENYPTDETPTPKTQGPVRKIK